MRTFSFFDNTGGMNQQVNDLLLQSNQAEEITNLHAVSSGRWSGSNVGYTPVNATALGNGEPVQSLYEYTTVAGVTHTIAVCGTQLLAIEKGSGQSGVIYTGLSASSMPMTFTTFNGLLIGTNGSNPPIQWNGLDAASILTGWPPVIPGISVGNPSISDVFANRLVFSGDALNPSVVYLSALESSGNFTPTTGATSAGAIQVSPGDGQRITALKTLFLPLENEEVLVIFKETATYLLTGQDPGTFTLQNLSGEFGAVSHRSITQVGNDLMVLSKEGITAISTATTQGNLTSGFVSNPIRSQLLRLNPFKLGNSFCLHLRWRQEVWWFVTESNTTLNQSVLVYNYGINRAWSKRTGIEALSGLVSEGKLYTGNYSGFIHRQLTGNTYNGQPVPWTYRTGFYDFASPRQRKRIKDIQLFLRQISALSFKVHCYWDFRRSAQQRETRQLSITPDASSSTYGLSRFGADPYHLIGTSVLQFTPSGSGRYFQMELTGDSTNTPVEIEGWIITTLDGGTR
jgi:hypothetical protein